MSWVAYFFCGLIFLLAGCRGAAPVRAGGPDAGRGAVLIGGRAVLPSGESRTGLIPVNLEAEKDGEVYRLPVTVAQTSLYEVEPGVYHLAQTRSLLGFRQPTLKIMVDRETYSVRFPKDISHRRRIRVKPGQIAVIGVVEARLQPGLSGQRVTVSARLDDGADSRRKLVEAMIREMTSPSAPVPRRDHAIAWQEALHKALIAIESEGVKR